MKFHSRVISKQLGELLIARKVLSKKKLQQALNKQKTEGNLIGRVLVDLGFAGEEDLIKILAAQYGYPYLPLKNYSIKKNILKLIPAQVAKHYYVVPVDKIKNVLTIVMADPLNAFAVKEVEQLTKMKIAVFVSTLTDINNSMMKYYGPAAGVSEEAKNDFLKISFASIKNSVDISKG